MRKQTLNRIKNSIAILLVAFFVMSATVGAVSAQGSGHVTIGPITTQVQAVTTVIPTVQTAVIVQPFSTGNSVVTLNNNIHVNNRLFQNAFIH
jgi:hypothetical protein